MFAVAIPFLLCWLFAELCNPALALAYLDPGTGSIIVQLLLGGVAGIVMVIKLYWKQLSNLFRKTPKTSKISPHSEKDPEM